MSSENKKKDSNDVIVLGPGHIDFNFTCPYVPHYNTDFDFPESCNNNELELTPIHDGEFAECIVADDTDLFVEICEGEEGSFDLVIVNDLVGHDGEIASAAIEMIVTLATSPIHDGDVGSLTNLIYRDKIIIGAEGCEGETSNSQILTFGVLSESNAYDGENIPSNDNTLITRSAIILKPRVIEDGEQSYNLHLRTERLIVPKPAEDGEYTYLAGRDSLQYLKAVDIGSRLRAAQDGEEGIRFKLGSLEFVKFDTIRGEDGERAEFDLKENEPFAIKEPIKDGESAVFALTTAYGFTAVGHDGDLVPEISSIEIDNSIIKRGYDGEFSSLTLNTASKVKFKTAEDGEYASTEFVTAPGEQFSFIGYDGDDLWTTIERLKQVKLFPRTIQDGDWVFGEMDIYSGSNFNISNCCKRALFAGNVHFDIARPPPLWEYSKEIPELAEVSLMVFREIDSEGYDGEEGSAFLFEPNNPIEGLRGIWDGGEFATVDLQLNRTFNFGKSSTTRDGNQANSDFTEEPVINEYKYWGNDGEEIHFYLSTLFHAQPRGFDGEHAVATLTTHVMRLYGYDGEQVRFSLKTTVNLHPRDVHDGENSDGKFFEPPWPMFDGEAMECILKTDYDVFITEDGCVTNEYTYYKNDKLVHEHETYEGVRFEYTVKGECG